VRIGEQTELTDFGFTGQRLDESTGGLMYYGARYYLPSLRRFISADTIVPGAGNPQALNRYAYVFNNPVNLIDPTGHRPPTEEEEQWWGMEGHHTGGGGGGGGGNAAQGIGNATGGDYQDHWNAHNEGDGGNPGSWWDEDSSGCPEPGSSQREAAEQAFLHFLEDPYYFANVYINATGASEEARMEYANLEVFAYNTYLHASVDDLVWQRMVTLNGIDFGMAMDDARVRNQFFDPGRDDPNDAASLGDVAVAAGLVLTAGEAIDIAVAWAGPEGQMAVTSGGNYYFWSETTYPDGSSIRFLSRLDVNPADSHVGENPHLNTEVYYRQGPYYRYDRVLFDRWPHMRIDAGTVRRGDHP
jgi:RHS repeat-associated protein